MSNSIQFDKIYLQRSENGSSNYIHHIWHLEAAHSVCNVALIKMLPIFQNSCSFFQSSHTTDIWEMLSQLRAKIKTVALTSPTPTQKICKQFISCEEMTMKEDVVFVHRSLSETLSSFFQQPNSNHFMQTPSIHITYLRVQERLKKQRGSKY